MFLELPASEDTCQTWVLLSLCGPPTSEHPPIQNCYSHHQKKVFLSLFAHLEHCSRLLQVIAWSVFWEKLQLLFYTSSLVVIFGFLELGPTLEFSGMLLRSLVRDDSCPCPSQPPVWSRIPKWHLEHASQGDTCDTHRCRRHGIFDLSSVRRWRVEFQWGLYEGFAQCKPNKISQW